MYIYFWIYLFYFVAYGLKTKKINCIHAIIESYILKYFFKIKINIFYLCLQTALHISAHIGCPKNIQKLLNHKANLLLQDSNGYTALDIALNTENTVCIKLLKDASGKFIILVLLGFFVY